MGHEEATVELNFTQFQFRDVQTILMTLYIDMMDIQKFVTVDFAV